MTIISDKDIKLKRKVIQTVYKMLDKEIQSHLQELIRIETNEEIRVILQTLDVHAIVNGFTGFKFD